MRRAAKCDFGARPKHGPPLDHPCEDRAGWVIPLRVKSGGYDPDVQDMRVNPTAIDVNRAAGTLRLGWADGHETMYDSVTLRWLCPCAYCRGEAGLPGWLDSNPTLTPAQTQITDAALVGTYAIQLTWGDGHNSGFHTYLLLREMCPCEACARAREQHREHGSPDSGDRHWHGGER